MNQNSRTFPWGGAAGGIYEARVRNLLPHLESRFRPLKAPSPDLSGGGLPAHGVKQNVNSYNFFPKCQLPTFDYQKLIVSNLHWLIGNFSNTENFSA